MGGWGEGVGVPEKQHAVRFAGIQRDRQPPVGIKAGQCQLKAMFLDCPFDPGHEIGIAADAINAEPDNQQENLAGTDVAARGRLGTGRRGDGWYPDAGDRLVHLPRHVRRTRGDWLMTRDTVDLETPAIFASSSIVPMTILAP